MCFYLFILIYYTNVIFLVGTSNFIRLITINRGTLHVTSNQRIIFKFTTAFLYNKTCNNLDIFVDIFFR